MGRDSIQGVSVKSEGKMMDDTEHHGANTVNTKYYSFTVGQHVFVLFGKTQYPGVIVSVEYPFARVRWSTMGTIDQVEIPSLRPMFDKKDGKLYSSQFSVRNRQPTDRFAPLLHQNMQRNKTSHIHCGQSRRREAKRKSHLDATETLDTLGMNLSSDRVSPRKRIKTKAPKQERTDNDHIMYSDTPLSSSSSYSKDCQGIRPNSDWKTDYASPSGKNRFHHNIPSTSKHNHPQNGKEHENDREDAATNRRPESPSSPYKSPPSFEKSHAISRCATMHPRQGPSKKTRSNNKNIPTELNNVRKNFHMIPLVSSRSQDADFIIRNLDYLPKLPSDIAPGSGWKSKSVHGPDGMVVKTRWISPSGRKFRCPRKAFEFERLVRQSNGNEEKAWTILCKNILREKGKHSKGREKAPMIMTRSLKESEILSSQRTRTPTDRYIPQDIRSTKSHTIPLASQSHGNTSKFGHSKPIIAKRTANEVEVEREFILKHLDTLPYLCNAVSPGPHWTVKTIIQPNGHKRNFWLSPGRKQFRCLRMAYRFERNIRQTNGDEAKAWVLYKRKYTGEKSTREPNMATSVKKQRKVLTSSDKPSKQARRRRVRKMTESAELQTSESLSYKDVRDYDSLWNYYMAPVTRNEEELRSGMIIRKKHAMCNLLRSKCSIFRRRLHRYLIDLEKKGRKAEILRILNEMKQFDMGVQLGDGPPSLLITVMGSQKGDEEVEAIDYSAVLKMKNQKATPNNISTMVEDFRSSSIVQLEEICIHGNPTIGVTKMAVSQLECERQAGRSLHGTSTLQKTSASSKISQVETTSSRGNVHVIDLCREDEDEQLRASQKKSSQNEFLDLRSLDNVIDLSHEDGDENIQSPKEFPKQSTKDNVIDLSQDDEFTDDVIAID